MLLSAVHCQLWGLMKKLHYNVYFNYLLSGTGILLQLYYDYTPRFANSDLSILYTWRN